MAVVAHVDIFRARLVYGWFDRYALAGAFECPLERIIDMRMVERWEVRDAQIYHMGQWQRGKEFNSESMSYPTQCHLVSGIVSMFEDELGPLLVASDADAAQFNSIYKNLSQSLLRAALYRARQFEYAAVAYNIFNMTVEDALTSVAKGFGIHSEIFLALNTELDVLKPDVFLDLNSDLRFLMFLNHFTALGDADLLPEFPGVKPVLQ